MTNLGAGAFIFFVNLIHILAVDPNPGPRAPLIALTKEKTATATGHGNEIFSLEIDFEPENVDIVVTAGDNIAHTQDRSDSAER